MKCADCKWFQCWGEDPAMLGQGWCHRYPPILPNLGDDPAYENNNWPVVMRYDYCGEFSEKETSEK